jgi:sortase (surface protein transpeptidase)
LLSPPRYLFGSSDVVVAPHRLYIAGVVGAVAVFLAASIIANHNRADEHASASAATSGLSQSHSAAPRSKAATPRAAPATPHPQNSGMFSLVVNTRYGNIPAQVGSISVASNEPVEPPHSTAEQWDTAVWVIESSYPSARSKGTTYVYGHACHYHVCPFTNLKVAAVGDLVVVTTPSAVMTYRVNRTGLSSKSARSLPSWASDSTVGDRIVLVTCEFEQGDTSINNIVVAATLSESTTG